MLLVCVCGTFVLIIYGMKSHNSNDVEVIVQINIVILITYKIWKLFIMNLFKSFFVGFM